MPKRDGRDLSRVLATKAAGDEAALSGLCKDSGVPDEVLGLLREEGEWEHRRLIVTEVGRAALCGALRRRAVAPNNEHR